MGLFSKKTEKENLPAKGKFIVIDGVDGTGKTTQIELLHNTLITSGYDAVIFDFPQYESNSSSMLEAYLAGEYPNATPEVASIFFAIDRFDAKTKIIEMLNNGKIVLANRYVTSNAGHQGGRISNHETRVAFYKWLENLEYNIFGVPRPDLTIILDLPVKISLHLINKRGRKTDIHESNQKHLEMARQIYLEIAGLFPGTKLVECYKNGLLTPGQIHTKVWELVRRIVLKQ